MLSQIINIFIRCGSSSTIVLVVYVDDTLLSESDIGDIKKIMEYFKQQFVTKDIGKLKFFLGLRLLMTNIE